MKRSLFIVVFLYLASASNGQILNQDASGKSSIVFQGSSINIDIGETLFKINHYGTFNKRKGLYGIDLQGKNESGLAKLFSSGDFSPNAELSFVIGCNKVTVQNPTIAEETEAEAERQNLLPKLEDAWKVIVDNKIEGCIDRHGNPTKSTTDLRTALKNIETKPWAEVSSNIYEVIAGIKDDDAICKAQLTEEALLCLVAIRTESLLTDYLAILKKIDSLSKNTKQYLKNKSRLWYLRTGVTPLEFKYDKGNSFALFDERFIDTLNVGFFIHGGASFQWRTNFLGFNIGYMYTNNFFSLKKEEYEFERVDPSMTPGILKQKESFKAYNGDFGRLGKIYINLDYLYMIDLGQSSYLLAGPYVRQYFSLDTDIEKGNTVLGGGLNYVNGASGKFLGGVYLQTEDLFGKRESSFRKTIQVGLITKFSLASIFLLK